MARNKKAYAKSKGRKRVNPKFATDAEEHRKAQGPFVCIQHPVMQHLTHASYFALMSILYTQQGIVSSKSLKLTFF